MYDTIKLLPLGTASTQSSLANLLGQIYIDPTGKIYRLCKAASAITACASKGLQTAYSAGVPTWVVDVPAAATTDPDVVFVPAGQVGSTGTTAFVANDYFYAQISGPATILAANTTLVYTAGQFLQVNTTGYVAAFTAYTAGANAGPGHSLRACNTAAATAAGQPIACLIAGLH